MHVLQPIVAAYRWLIYWQHHLLVAAVGRLGHAGGARPSLGMHKLHWQGETTA